MSKRKSVIRYRPPTTVDAMINELLVWFAPDEDDVTMRRAGLLPRLMASTRPGSQPAQENPGKPARGVRPGSPAPWSAGPAELVDEIHHGAIALSCRIRQTLDFGPLVIGQAHAVPRDRLQKRRPVRTVYVWHDRRAGGAKALADIRRLLPALEHLQDDQRMKRPTPVLGPVCLRCAQRRPHRSCHVIAAIRVDELVDRVQRDVARWHGEALILVGRGVRWVPLGEILNPALAGDEKRLGVRGPLCGEDDLRRRGVVAAACGHDSCWEIRKGRPRRYVQARCPWCGSPSLYQNPMTRQIVCTRSSCEDEGGNRPAWTEQEMVRLIGQWTRP